MGYPYETLEHCWKSVDFAAQIDSDDINAFIFTQYHGTPMRDMCVEAGFIDKDLIVEMVNDDQGSFLDMPPPYMSKDEIYEMYLNFPRLFRERRAKIST